MIQGTTSNAGKSILVTAFCRIFTRYGLNVSPFKAQNMSLNSFVTPDNCEIGRAQAIQAAACRKACDVRMNPILLKPDSRSSSQIVVMGTPVSSMQFRDYSEKRRELEQIVHTSYDALAAQSDLMIPEGAGSPAEVNLIDTLRQRKNLGKSEFHSAYAVDKAIDTIADCVEKSVAMKAIKTMLGL
jgi:cobyric acid synthase